MRARIPGIYLAAGLWIILMGVALLTRPPLPVDETRYLAVAWEMWLRGDFLVPYLNGETYSHKPPLLFWLMHAGWALFGVNDWSPRLIAPLFGLGSLFLTQRLARTLWPSDHLSQDLSVLVLMGCAFWTLFVTLTMFDMMLAFFALLGLLGVVDAWLGRRWQGLAMVAVAIGLGILCKGPAILLHILPVALTAPLWGRRLVDHADHAVVAGRVWYGQLLVSVVAGVAIALVWAIPAGMAGGDAYQHAIFWGQAAGRMVESFAHQRPFWWYTVILPGLVLPWFIWPPLWRAAAAYGARLWQDGGSLLCLIWLAAAFLIFSLISGKQLHYLLPEFPALALLAARFMAQSDDAPIPGRGAMVLPSVLFALLGLALVLMPLGVLPGRMPDWASLVSGNWGIVLVLLAIGILVARPAGFRPAVCRLMLLPAGLVLVLHLALMLALDSRYNLKPLAEQLKVWQTEGIAIANFGKYHGQFQFLGRLHKPLAVVGLRVADIQPFLDEHPNGKIVAYYDQLPDQAEPLALHRFRENVVVVWDVQTVIAHPGIGNRR